MVVFGKERRLDDMLSMTLNLSQLEGYRLEFDRLGSLKEKLTTI